MVTDCDMHVTAANVFAQTGARPHMFAEVHIHVLLPKSASAVARFACRHACWPRTWPSSGCGDRYIRAQLSGTLAATLVHVR